MGRNAHESTLAIIEVARMRPEAPDYHRATSVFIDAAARAAAVLPWSVRRVVAEDGIDAVLAETLDADALLILGGEDIAPEYSGLTPGYPNEGAHRPRADEAQLALLQRAFIRRTPVLGVCRGLQLINVALGGRTIADLGAVHAHRVAGVPAAESPARNTIHVEPSSALAAALGAGTREVICAHHQAIETPGVGLDVVARAADGTIEAVEHRDLPVRGVQFHPESPAADAWAFRALLSQLHAQVQRPAAARWSVAA